MTATDVSASRAELLPGGIGMGATHTPQGLLMRHELNEEYLEWLSGHAGTSVERIWDPVILVHGPIANLWSPFDFYRNGESRAQAARAHTVPIQRSLLMCRYGNLIPAVVLVCAAASVPESALAQITAIDAGAMTWERADTPGFPEGAMRKLLKIDQETGIGAALRWHPKGFVEPRHYHTTAAHSIYVLEDSVFLIWSEGPLDIELGDPPNTETPEPAGIR